MVDLPFVKSLTQAFGLQKDSVLLIIDNAGPFVMGLQKSDSGSIDAQHVSYINIQFSEAVVGFNTASVQLKRNGNIVPLNIAQLSNSNLQNWMAGNFGFETYPDANYTFTIFPG